MLKRLDVYPKVISDFRESTASGGVVSLVTALIVLALLVSEASFYLARHVEPELFVDTTRADKIRINLDITFPSMPCAWLTLDAMDSSGELQLDLSHNVFKKRLKDGVPVGVVRENVAQRAEAVPQDGKEEPSSEAPATTTTTTVPGSGAVAAGKPGCGSCYGAQTRPEQCCNTCEEVRRAVVVVWCLFLLSPRCIRVVFFCAVLSLLLSPPLFPPAGARGLSDPGLGLCQCRGHCAVQGRGL